jgi:5,10-methylenetetrahydromethanopterin reductase
MEIEVSAGGSMPAAELIEFARASEHAGIGAVWLGEDYCERGVFSMAGAVLAATQTLRVGIGVVNPWTRHPVLTAMETATLAELAPGRVVLGLGTSNPRWMSDELGIDYERPIRRLEEASVIVRAALAGETVTHCWNGRPLNAHLEVPDVGHVPIALGLKSERALRSAAPRADIVLLSLLSSPPYVAWVRSVVGPNVSLAVLAGTSIGADPAAAREAIRPFAARFLGIHGSHVITKLAGISEELAQSFRAGWQSGSPRTDLVTDDHLELLVIGGDRKSLQARIHEFAAAGADTLILQHRGLGSPIDLLAELRRD